MIKKQMKAATRAIDSIQPSINNPRNHTDEQIQLIANSIKEYGFVVRILIDSAGGIIAGEGRWTAAKQLGLKEVPVIIADDFTDVQKLAYQIADNRMAQLPEYDHEKIGAELKDLAQWETDLDTLGYNPEDVRQAGAQTDTPTPSGVAGGGDGGGNDSGGGGTPGKAAEAIPAIELPAGDAWLVGGHKIAIAKSKYAAQIVKEATLMLGAVSGGKVDFTAFSGSLCCLWTRGAMVGTAKCIADAGFQLKYAITVPDRIPHGESDRYALAHTTGLLAVRGVPPKWLGGRKQSTVWEMILSSSAMTDEVAPVEARRRVITNHLSRGAVVFDSNDSEGKTIIAAESEQRLAVVWVKNRAAAARVAALAAAATGGAQMTAL